MTPPKRPPASQPAAGGREGPPEQADVELPGMPPVDTAPDADRAPKRPVRGPGGRFQPAGHSHEPKRRPFARKPPEPEPKRGPGRPSNRSSYAQLRKDVQSTIDQTCGALALVSMVSPRLAYDVAIIGANSEALSDELVRQAEAAPWLERALRSLVKARESGKLLVLLTGIAVPIAANHGLLPAGVAELVGAPAPPQPNEDGTGTGLGDVLNLFNGHAGPAAPDPAAAHVPPA